MGEVCQQLGYWAVGNRYKEGVRLIWAFMWNCGNHDLQSKIHRWTGVGIPVVPFHIIAPHLQQLTTLLRGLPYAWPKPQHNLDHDKLPSYS
ncbi:MAG: hypothetical protein HY860_04395 [Chlamydiales bacterium]|nr:hypothetical protein [Chlamydiales bacterium]